VHEVDFHKCAKVSELQRLSIHVDEQWLYKCRSVHKSGHSLTAASAVRGQILLSCYYSCRTSFMHKKIISTFLLPQEQNVSHQMKVLLFCVIPE